MKQEKTMQDKRQRQLDDEKKIKEMESYNPWGKGGAGAPNKPISTPAVS